jgi:hypothetical protein
MYKVSGSDRIEFGHRAYGDMIQKFSFFSGSDSDLAFNMVVASRLRNVHIGSTSVFVYR